MQSTPVMVSRLVVVAVGFVMIGGCGSHTTDGSSETDAADLGRADAGAIVERTPPSGEQAYAEPLPGGNTFACATCHALTEPAEDGLRRPGHPIGDAFNRTTFKAGALVDLRDAVNSCVTEWMAAEPLPADSETWRLLEGYLQQQAGDRPGQAVALQIVQPPSDPGGGDAIRGMETFDGTCAVCHGAGAAGTRKAPSLIGTRLDAETIARRIRTSGSSRSEVYAGLTGGIMPFWGADRLSDAELRDVVAYVEQIGQMQRTERPNGGPGPLGPSGCGSDHAKVGHTATLSGFAHGVAGTVRVVDNCTLVFENFTFDGGGIDIQIYGGRDGDFDPPTGFSMSDNLLGQVFQQDTLTVRLPDGRTLDDFDAVSVWCVAVGTSFGDATF